MYRFPSGPNARLPPLWFWYGCRTNRTSRLVETSARPLLHQFELEVLFAKDNPESATEWLQAEMMEIAHEARSVGAAGVN